ncbi:MAG: substrate-binding domain-containing protein [Rhizobacter sp.]|nr:substrate-binding domain-containing protein [Bacteriovorax sp.]
MRIITLKFLLFMAIMMLVCTQVSAADVTVIINAKNPVNSITNEELNAFFIKKERNWKDGNAVRFFDHRDENNNRKLFLKKYIKKTSREIELYWIGEKIYTGNIAPIQITSDSMMVSMVSRFSGGIGYVSSKFVIPKTVKRITVTNSEGKQ